MNPLILYWWLGITQVKDYWNIKKEKIMENLNNALKYDDKQAVSNIGIIYDKLSREERDKIIQDDNFMELMLKVQIKYPKLTGTTLYKAKQALIEHYMIRHILHYPEEYYLSKMQPIFNSLSPKEQKKCQKYLEKMASR